MVTATRDEIRQALLLARRGAVVKLPLSDETTVRPTVYQCTFTDDTACSSHVITASWSVSGEDPSNPDLGIAPAALKLIWFQGDVEQTALVDLPVGGTVVEVPSCNACIVSAIVQPQPAPIAPAGEVDAAWTISGMPGHATIARQNVLTSPFKTIVTQLGTGRGEFVRQGFAVGYRVISSNVDMNAQSVQTVQGNGTGLTSPTSIDSPAVFYGPTNVHRDMWGFVPLHPRTTKVTITVNQSGDYAVQWLLQLG